MSKIIKVATPLVGEEEVQAVREVLLSGYYTSGEKVKQFENNFSEYIRTKYGIATNSGTSALHIALASIGVGPGDEVIVPSLTFFSTATSVIHQNAIPIFADIDPETYCIDPNDTENKITEKTKAIIPVDGCNNGYRRRTQFNSYRRLRAGTRSRVQR
ncbi:MAG TPA: DegT/DnrJ/EryC1/StrS aminotransferase family protein [Methanosarcinales archaeon]|nr:DegT/DnrJ/EryC1/StrS aminotransferase family protein [Methanosarcinales archaeon]